MMPPKPPSAMRAPLSVNSCLPHPQSSQPGISFLSRTTSATSNCPATRGAPGGATGSEAFCGGRFFGEHRASAPHPASENTASMAIQAPRELIRWSSRRRSGRVTLPYGFYDTPDEMVEPRTFFDETPRGGPDAGDRFWRREQAFDGGAQCSGIARGYVDAGLPVHDGIGLTLGLRRHHALAH